MQGSNVLITGGLGFIGSNLAFKIAAEGGNVTLVDSLVPEYGGSLYNVRDISPAARINISDVRDPFSLSHLLAGQDFLFNLAGQTSHLDSMEDPFTDLEINCKAQLSILEICRRVNPSIRIVFASTRQIYGKPQKLPVDESHPICPVDVNGIHKAAAEHYHFLYSHVYGLNVTALRFTNVYGPRMRIKDARQTFLGCWIRSVVAGEPFEVWGGKQRRDFCFVDDAVTALLRTAVADNAAGKAVNIGGSEVFSLEEVAKILTSLREGSRYVVREFPEERARIDIGDYYSDNSLAASLLKWSPAVSLHDGLNRTLDYYSKHLDAYL